VVQRAQYNDLKVYMPNDPLVKVDRMSMQHGLEIRCPLLDHRVVEFAFRLPTSLKMKRLSGKHLLRTLAARRLPASLARLPKRGFTAPVGRWLAADYGDAFAAEVLAPGSHTAAVVDLAELRRMFENNRKSVGGSAYPLWAAWVFERWAGAAASREHRVVA
jgi:asparagine synthase (glutamine-hydrolysing)